MQFLGNIILKWAFPAAAIVLLPTGIVFLIDGINLTNAARAERARLAGIMARNKLDVEVLPAYDPHNKYQFPLHRNPTPVIITDGSDWSHWNAKQGQKTLGPRFEDANNIVTCGIFCIVIGLMGMISPFRVGLQIWRDWNTAPKKKPPSLKRLDFSNFDDRPTSVEDSQKDESSPPIVIENAPTTWLDAWHD